MKCTKIMLSGLVAFAATANAMPTQEQTKKVEPLVMDLMREDQAALKSGKKTRVEVAESAMALADQAESEAAKLLLIKGAFNLYVRAGEFDKAIETLQTMQTAIPDMPPANMVNIIEASLRVVSRKNGGQLYRLLDETKTRMRYTNEAASLEKSVKRSPTDRTLRTRLAEHYAYLGKWDMALENFAATDGKVGAIAKSEREGKAAAEKVADFWWNYPTGKADELVKCFRTHAAKLYEDAIASGDIKGLNKVQAERRIEEAKGYRENVFEAPEPVNGLYCVIDLSAGSEASKYPVSYLNAVPKGGWSDIYKTSKLVLRRIDPGSFQMGSGSQNPKGVAKTRISKPYYIGIFEFTQKQCELIQGWVPGTFKGNDMYPVCGIAYQEIRGSNAGSAWPKSNAVDRNSILGRLRSKTGLTFDLPTEAQWEYACRAGAKTDFANGKNLQEKEKDPSLDKLACYGDKTGSPANVGTYQPNAWDLYDVHGNINEWCRDWCGSIVGGTDPKGAQDSTRGRVVRSGAWSDPAWICALNNRFGRSAEINRNHFGFRLSIDIGVKGEVATQDDTSAMTQDNVKDSKVNDFKEPVPNVEYKFSYKLEGGNAIITGIDPKPVGTVVMPDKIDGHKVTGMEGYNDRSPFWGCDQLTRVVLPAGLELGPADAFFSCKSLSSIEISRSNKKFASRDGTLYSKDFSTLIVYPKTRESVKLSPKTRKVGVCAFRGCALKTAKIPEGIVEVGPWNLCRCPDLELIEFPKSLKHLGQCAAHGNDKLKKIVFNGDAPQVGLGQFSWGKQYVFTGAPEDLVVEVRKGTKGWKSPSSTELPERWPTNQSESRPIRYIK